MKTKTLKPINQQVFNSFKNLKNRKINNLHSYISINNRLSIFKEKKVYLNFYFI